MMAGLAEAEGVRWYVSDHLGTVRDLADAAGEVIDHIAYDSFGNVLAESNPAAGDRFRFTGREFDAATGQYYYRARYYDGRIGRFTSEDPLGVAAGDKNLYRYVLNRPTAATDPTGLWSLWEEIYLLPGTIYYLPQGYWETGVSGGQTDSLLGWINGVTDALNPVGGGLPTTPIYGNEWAFSGGRTVGRVTGIGVGAVLSVAGVAGTVSALQYVHAAGGLLQVGELALAGGGTIFFAVVNGEALPLTAELAVSLGISAAGGLVVAGGIDGQIAYSVGVPGESGGGVSRDPWEDMEQRHLRKWLEQLETTRRRLSVEETRRLLFHLEERGWTVLRNRGVEFGRKFGHHVHIVGPGGGPKVHLSVPAEFTF